MRKKPVPQATPEEVTLNLELSLAARRRRAPAAWESEQGIHKRRFTRALEEVDQAATLLSQDVSSLLSERVDELSTYHHDFRVGINRVFLRVLRMARERSEQVVLFNEAVPGFTLMLFKKDPASWTATEPTSEAVAAESGPEIAAAGQVISQFVRRTGDRVLTVESDDALFVFFPTSDVKKNLKEMGFYFTDQ